MALSNPTNANGILVDKSNNPLLTTQQTTIAELTDSTGGTANDTLENLADGSTYATDHAAIENNFADLGAKVNAILQVLAAHGLIADS